MSYILIVFSSSVSGSRLKNAAYRANIKDVKITQTPVSIKTGGCSYSLKVRKNDLGDILNLAHQKNIRYTAVYEEVFDLSGTIIYNKL